MNNYIEESSKYFGDYTKTLKKSKEKEELKTFEMLTKTKRYLKTDMKIKVVEYEIKD